MANEPRKGNPLDMLYQIVNDLWPGSAPKAVQKPESEEAGQAAKDFVDTYMAKTADVLGNPPEAPAPAVQATEPEPAVVSGPPPFEESSDPLEESSEYSEIEVLYGPPPEEESYYPQDSYRPEDDMPVALYGPPEMFGF